MTQEQLLQRNEGWPNQLPPSRNRKRSSAQAADRTCRDFEHEHASAIHAALGVNRTVLEADRRRGARHGLDDGGAPAVRRRRRRDVDRSPRRTDRRAGRACRRWRGRASAPWCISPSSANSRPGMNASSSARVVRVVPLGAHVRRSTIAPEPIERPRRGRGRRRRASRRGFPTARAVSRRTGYARGAERGFRPQGVGSGFATVYRTAGTRAPAGPRRADARACGACRARARPRRADGQDKPSALRDARRDHRRPIADGETPSIGPLARRLDNRGNRRVFVVESESGSRCPARGRR